MRARIAAAGQESVIPGDGAGPSSESNLREGRRLKVVAAFRRIAAGSDEDLCRATRGGSS